MSDSAFAIILNRSKVLLVKPRHKDHWQLPGGRIERGETPVQALRREIEEETGLEAVVGSLTGTYRRADGSLARVFRARAAGTLAGKTREIEEQRWVRPAKAEHLVGGATRRRLRDALRKIS